MESRRLPALIALSACVVAVALFLRAQGRHRRRGLDGAHDDARARPPTRARPSGGDEQEPDEAEAARSRTCPSIEIKDGQPVGGVQELEVAKGDEIRFIVESDVDDEVHLHGYDVYAGRRAPAAQVEFKVPATIEGVFEVELEHSVVPIAEISVSPRLSAAPLAHALAGKQDLPIPEWLFAWGASLVLIVSFVALSVAWREPRFEEDRWRAAVGAASRGAAREPRHRGRWRGAIGVFLLGVTVWAGLYGTEAPDRNFSVTFVFVTVWLGLRGRSASCFGDVFRAFNPWRAIARVASARRSGWSRARRRRAPLPYPERLGRWPAAIGLLAFLWLELVYGAERLPDRRA